MIIIDYKLIISNLNYYIYKKEITKAWIVDVAGLNIKELNKVLRCKVKIDSYYIYDLEMTADVLDLTLEELNDEKFKEKLNEQLKKEEYIWDKADTISQIEDMGHISNRIIDVIEHKGKEWQKSIRNKLNDIRALCDSVEKRIGDE